MHTEYTINIDKREGKPLPFPDHICVLADGATAPAHHYVRIHAQAKSSRTGDYVVDGHADRCIVECKRALREVAANCLTKEGRRKFTAELQRLISECAHPYVLLEGSISKLLREPAHNNIPPEVSLDALTRILLEYGIPLLLVERSTPHQSRAVGILVAHLLVNGVISPCLNLRQTMSKPPATPMLSA
jgi:hypothetical protein